MQVDVEAVDFGLVAFGFRYAKEFTLHNTCVIPMQYAWRVPKDSLDPAHKEFTVSSSAKSRCCGHALRLILWQYHCQNPPAHSSWYDAIVLLVLQIVAS